MYLMPRHSLHLPSQYLLACLCSHTYAPPVLNYPLLHNFQPISFYFSRALDTKRCGRLLGAALQQSVFP
jgi:hypothetical protein